MWERTVATAVLVFAVVMVYFASRYHIGDLSNMGPGYFPVLIGVLLAVVGMVNLLANWHSREGAPEIPWLAFLLVLGGIAVWAFLVERVGLFPASVSLIVLASLARRPLNPVQIATTAVVGSLVSALVFIYGFGLPLKILVW
ncbi:tripartite tricarboxylate transporter TctB family protein [Mesorhizobium sp. ASY16-5R]|uniref:tripartite tricarboxylate transporter TctB family protein n=1 Tax=Mesorhizobium sp. ASY16-5R TaxID=3445772 RepID=UPI003FA092D3